MKEHDSNHGKLCIFRYVYKHVNTYIHIYIHIYIDIDIYIYIYIYIYRHTCIHILLPNLGFSVSRLPQIPEEKHPSQRPEASPAGLVAKSCLTTRPEHVKAPGTTVPPLALRKLVVSLGYEVSVG